MKIWKRLPIFCISFIFLLIPNPISKACGPSDYGFYGYSFINPKIVNTEANFAPFLLGFEQVYKDHFDQANMIQLKGNIAEWNSIFCNLFKPEDIRAIVYSSSLDEISILRTIIASKDMKLPGRLSKNMFVRHLRSHKCLETIDYLIFAKRCEPHVTATSGWETPRRNKEAMEKLIDEGRKVFKKTKSNYIKLRYAYQMIRLAHYAGNYQEVLKLYNFLLPKTDKVDSIINYWILGHKAGALYKLGERIEAAYLYTKIFQNCPTKRASAYQSFSVKTDEEWFELLLKCEDDDERATLYAIRAHANESKAVEEMKKIYALNPDNENLELLLVREIKKLEKDLLGLDFNSRKQKNKIRHKIPRKEAGDYLINLQKFIQKIIEEQKLKNINLWRVADGYLEMLAGDYYAARKTFNKIEHLVKDKELQEQLSAFQLALKITSYSKIDEEQEEEIADIVRKNALYKKYKDFPDFLYDKLAKSYVSDGSPGKAFRTRYDIKDLSINPQEEIIEDLLKICQKENPTKFETALVTKKDGTTIENDLLDMKGTRLFTEFQLEAALEVLKKIPREERDKYQIHPFADRIHDCVSCEVDEPDSLGLNKVEFLERILELEYKGRADLEKGAFYFYQLGNAFYNISYFGNSWQALDYYRSGGNHYFEKDNIYPLFGSPYGNIEQVDLSKALYYYEKARLLSKNPELAARASFMAAKCEQKMYFTSEDCKYNRYKNLIPDLPKKYQKHFLILKNEYEDTEIYEEIIEECKYFRVFANK